MAQLIDIKMDLAEARRIVVAQIKKERGQNTIVLFKVGEVIKAYDEDAKAIATHCFTIAIGILGGKAINITKDMIDVYFPRLIKNGYKICVIE